MLLPALLSLAVAVPEAGEALEQTGVRPGLSIGVRPGYLLPYGSFSEDEELRVQDVFYGFGTLQAEAAFTFAGRFAVGAYYERGIGQLNEEFCRGSQCSASSDRFGALVTMLFPVNKGEGWAGAFAGFDQVSMDAEIINVRTGRATRVTLERQGIEGGLQAGYRYPLHDRLRAGPYLGASVGQYLGFSKPAAHLLLAFGVRLEWQPIGWVATQKPPPARPNHPAGPLFVELTHHLSISEQLIAMNRPVLARRRVAEALTMAAGVQELLEGRPIEVQVISSGEEAAAPAPPQRRQLTIPPLSVIRVGAEELTGRQLAARLATVRAKLEQLVRLLEQQLVAPPPPPPPPPPVETPDAGEMSPDAGIP